MTAPLSAGAQRPSRAALEGRYVTLAPLDAAEHGKALWENMRGAGNDRLWRYMNYGPFADWSEFHAQLEKMAASEDPLYFALLGAARRAAGWASYLRIETAHRTIEVGSIVFSPALQRTRAATEAMYLMARYAFEDLGYRRYEWKCDALNEASRRAALRIGFTFEGIFRQHMIVKGRNRDTAWYSMLDSEWPARKAAFERWLEPGNFDEAEVQRSGLRTVL
jgi:RimJ/RimL family protein N-acetyltransferase